MSVEEYMAAARVQVPYSLIEEETVLLDVSRYPFGEGRLPIMCKSLGEEIVYKRAYVSGGRSIVLPSDNGWFKAKGIGSYELVPPRYYKGRVLSYYLERDVIGSGSLVWGFLTESEAQRELKWMEELRDAGLPVPEVLGMGTYKKVSVIDFKDRQEMRERLAEASPADLLGEFSERARRSSVCCIFCLEPTDVRVSELLQDFTLHYMVEESADEDCRKYVRWLGSSCAYNLRQLHDHGILHGTIRKEGGFLTNAHAANHLVGEGGTWMTDYHLARRVESDEERTQELNCLLQVFNPFRDYYFLLEEQRALHQLAKEFLEGIKSGYQGDIFDIEPGLKTKMLREAAQMRREWKARSCYSR